MKILFDFFILCEFLGLWGKCSAALYLSYEEKYVSVRQQPCVWLSLGFSLVLVDWEWLIELTVSAGYVHKCSLNTTHLFLGFLHIQIRF